MTSIISDSNFLAVANSYSPNVEKTADLDAVQEEYANYDAAREGYDEQYNDYGGNENEEYYETEQGEGGYYEGQQEGAGYYGEPEEGDYQYYQEATTETGWGDEQKEEVKDSVSPEYDDHDVYQNQNNPPGLAGSDVSDNGDENEDNYEDTSSQRYIAEAKMMANEEPSMPPESAEKEAEDNIESLSSEEEEAHSQAKAYRHRAQADRIGRKSKVNDLINQFEPTS